MKVILRSGGTKNLGRGQHKEVSLAVYKTAVFRVTEDGVTDALAAIRRFVGDIKDNEPGTLQYTSVQC